MPLIPIGLLLLLVGTALVGQHSASCLGGERLAHRDRSVSGTLTAHEGARVDWNASITAVGRSGREAQVDVVLVGVVGEVDRPSPVGIDRTAHLVGAHVGGPP